MSAVPIIDEQDIGLLTQYNFMPVYASGAGYQQVYDPKMQKTLLLHRVIAGAGKGDIVDHVNRNKLDCRRANLRLVTKSQNTLNAPKREGTSSIYRGVTKTKSGTWTANFKMKGLGSYKTEAEAAKAYDDAVIRDGNADYVPLNFAEGVPCQH